METQRLSLVPDRGEGATHDRKGLRTDATATHKRRVYTSLRLPMQVWLVITLQAAHVHACTDPMWQHMCAQGRQCI